MGGKSERIAKNTIFLYFRMMLVLLVSLYTTRVVLNALGVVDYGIKNVVAGFVSMFAFLNTSMSNGIQRFYNFKLGKEGEESLTKVFNIALLIQGMLALVVVVLLETIGLWYLNTKMVIPIDRMPTAFWIYHFSVISLILVIMQIPFSAAIMAHERMDYYAIVSIIDVFMKLGFALYLPYVEYDKLMIYGIYTLGISIMNFLMYYVYCKIQFRSLVLKLQYHKDLFREMLSFSGWNIFGTFAYMLKNQGLNVLLNAFFGPVVNASRGVSGMIGNAIHGFSSNIIISFRPQIVQSYAGGDTQRVKKLMYSLSKLSYFMLYMLSMPIIIELPSILYFWLGDTIPEYTVSFSVLMLVIMILSALNTPLSQVVHATGRMKNYQIGTSLVICVILPLAWLVLRLGGDPNTVYYVSLTMTIINQAVCMILLKKVFKYSIIEYLKEVIRPCVIVTVLATILPLILHYIIPSALLRIVAVAGVGIVGTSLLTYYVAFNEYEKTIILKFVHKLIRKNAG